MTEELADSTFLSRLASGWRPTLPPLAPTVDEAEYEERFLSLLGELEDNAKRGHARAVSALAGQILEFVLKAALEAKGEDRRDMQGWKGTLGPIITMAREDGLYFNPNEVQTKGSLDINKLDKVKQTYLVQNAISQAKQYRDLASHAAPWFEPPSQLQASRQLGAVIALAELVAPTLPKPGKVSAESHMDELHRLRVSNADLSVAFLPRLTVERVDEVLAELHKTGEDECFEDLVAAVVRRPAWLFARAANATLPDVRSLIARVYASGHPDLSYVACVLLPVDELTLTHLVRRTGKAFADHLMMARAADSETFARVLSRDKQYFTFRSEFVKQATGTSDKGPDTLHKADYLARGFGNLPARLRNRIFVDMGREGALEWLRACKFGAQPQILGGISDAAIGKVVGLRGIRDALREDFVVQVEEAPPRYIVRHYLVFAHGVSRPYREQLYGAMLDSVASHDENEQEAGACRLLLEIAVTVRHRGMLWSRCQQLAAVASRTASDEAIRAAHYATAQGPWPSFGEYDMIKEAVDALQNLAEKEALVTHFVATGVLATEGLAPALREGAQSADMRAKAIIQAHRDRTNRRNPIDEFTASLVGSTGR